MKQETVNSFDGGLNLDLNPITTPNNVLTDCLNGTFLTFNGDEMVLQNDAGNTTISYNNSDITLDQGFYPLGVKEYGGVLYIVSAKKPVDNSILFSGGPYNKNTIVYSLVTGNKIYFVSKIDYNTQPLPIETNEYWEVVGDIYKFNNRFGLVQFGSYPSPKFGGSTSNIGTINQLYSSPTSNSILPYLYSPKILNTYEFKSGRYTMFNLSTINDVSLISTYSTPKVYKIKLWHQLNNGFLDLTTSVWESYKNFTGGTSGFWFDHDTFKYYCPNLYKGKLAVSAEIEDIPTFNLQSTPSLEYDVVDNQYTFVVKVNAIGNGYLNVPQAKINIVLREIDTQNIVNYESISHVSANSCEFQYTFSNIYSGWILEYTVSPIITCNLVDITANLREIPEYWKNQIILGKRVITTSVDDVKFYLGKSRCLTPLPSQAHTEVILKNKNGDLLDVNLEVTTTPHVFLEVGTTPSTTSNVIAYFDRSSNKPIINFNHPYLPIIDPVLVSFEKLTIVSEKRSCGYVNVTIALNIPIMGSYITLTQNGINYVGSAVENTSHIFSLIHPDIPFNVSIVFPERTLDLTPFSLGVHTREIFENIYENDIVVTESNTLSYVCIAYMAALRLFNVDTQLYQYNGIWFYDRDLSSNIPYMIGTTIASLTYVTNNPTNPYYHKYIGNNLHTRAQPYTDLPILFEGGVLEGSYRNIDDPLQYCQLFFGGYRYVFRSLQNIPFSEQILLEN